MRLANQHPVHGEPEQPGHGHTAPAGGQGTVAQVNRAFSFALESGELLLQTLKNSVSLTSEEHYLSTA